MDWVLVQKLRYAGKCAVCLTGVAAGQSAHWNRQRKTIMCLACGDGQGLVQSGAAGASAEAMALRRAQQEAERKEQFDAKQDALQAAYEARRPFLSRLFPYRRWLYKPAQPNASKAWSKGAEGEKKVAAQLDMFSGPDRYLTLHDRRIPGSASNLDHLAVSAEGVWIIDAKNFNGPVRKVNKGGLLRPDYRLIVNGRDRTKLVESLIRQIGHVSTSLAGVANPKPIQVIGALCFVDRDKMQAFDVQGVLVTGQIRLSGRLMDDGPLDREQRIQVHRHLAAAFPPAT